MSPTAAGRTSQGRIRGAVYRHLESASGSLYFHPQNCDPSLSTVSVRSITPRIIPIQGNCRYLARNGLRRATWDWFV